MRLIKEIKDKFDELQFSYKMKGNKKTQSKLLELLLNNFSNNNQLKEKKEIKN